MPYCALSACGASGKRRRKSRKPLIASIYRPRPKSRFAAWYASSAVPFPAAFVPEAPAGGRVGAGGAGRALRGGDDGGWVGASAPTPGVNGGTMTLGAGGRGDEGLGDASREIVSIRRESSSRRADRRLSSPDVASS